ncbi:Cas10/Cmr2 second palm domain-containing protein [Micromonospora sp. SH-82]|uniref:Cas10/Cmr2 second palm domain-containing protein n=1 Tax=Micromonospora sp. SH-82 TaxID=3132938 RepID=UPI003EC0EA6C
MIETGGNQAYIFGSNRLRHVVGASQLVHEVGTEWVPDAAATLAMSPDSVVMTASGKALLLVDSAAAGKAVIREVTRRALTQAPGLRVTGVVGPGFDSTDDTAYEKARRDTYTLHSKVRAARADPLLRDRVFPWHRLCRDSGRPAAREEVYGAGEPPVPASAGMLARSSARNRAHRRLRNKLGGRLATVIPTHLDELRHDGWTAVVHADGNGVGELFLKFAAHVATIERAQQVPLDTYARYQRDVAAQLDDATWDAVRDAVGALVDELPDDLTGRLLPIVVGGDDVTVACDASLAVPFVRYFTAAFARRTAEQPTLSAIARVATGHAGLTASAGIAVVKSHHPFATAYGLAEALTVSAKQLKSDGRALAAFDIHVAHTSTLRDLKLLRQYVRSDDGTPVARHAGPYLIGRAEDLPGELRHRSVELLDEVDGWLRPDGGLSAAQAHALRDAADRSLAEYHHQLELLLARVADPQRVHDLLDVQSDPAVTAGEAANATDGSEARPGDPPPVGQFLRLFDALHLRGLRTRSADLPPTQAVPVLDGGAS